MKRLVLDVETYLMRPAWQSPKPVVVGVSKDGDSVQLVKPQEAAQLLLQAADQGTTVIGHNVAFDMAVMMQWFPECAQAIWHLYNTGRISDTLVREKLIKLAEGRLSFDWKRKRVPRFGLDDLVEEYLGLDISEGKDNKFAWRYRFSELDGIPFEQWPGSAIEYAKGDIIYTLQCWDIQGQAKVSELGEPYAMEGEVRNEADQVRAAFALLLTANWGLRTNKERVYKLAHELEEKINGAKGKLSKFLRPNGSKNMAAIQAAVMEAYNGEPPRTEPSESHPQGQVRYDTETLEESGSEELYELADMMYHQKLLSTFVPILESGIEYPIHPYYDVLKETGRVSCSNPPLQQVPRDAGIRECFEPRPGWCYGQADYTAAELCSLAQVCIDKFGWSRMAEAINKGQDLHILLASKMVGCTPEELKARVKAGDKQAKNLRQGAKAGNFGFPGGLGWRKFSAYAKKSYGVTIDDETAKRTRQAWLETWPEVGLYVAWVKDQLMGGDRFTLMQHRSERQRGGCGYCEGANSLFQGLTADGAKRALYRVTEESYNQPASPLYGSRGGVFMHDEIIREFEVSKADAGVRRMSQVMVESMKEYIPDVKITADPNLMGVWSKDAKVITDSEGRLVPWFPKRS